MLKISIPTPCHEDWNKMTPDETGRHCSACAKSVVDFTGMSDEEVKHFFLNKKEDEKVCGRFKQIQLHSIVIELPQNIFSIQMPLWKKFLAACLIIFSSTLFSCETKVTTGVIIPEISKAVIDETKNDIGGQILVSDTTLLTVSTCPVTAGMGIVFVKTVPVPFLHILKDSGANELQGDIDIIEADSASSKQADTIPVPQQKNEIIFMGDSIYEEVPAKKLKSDSLAKTKNPPKADSINCNTIKNYY